MLFTVQAVMGVKLTTLFLFEDALPKYQSKTSIFKSANSRMSQYTGFSASRVLGPAEHAELSEVAAAAAGDGIGGST